MVQQRLAGRRLYLSQGGERPSNSEGRFPGEEWVYGCPAGQRDHVQGSGGEIIGATEQRGCEHLVPALGDRSESRARLVNAFWEELPPPTPFVPCRGAAFSSAFPGPRERKSRRGMRSTLYGGAGAGVGTGSRWERIARPREHVSPRRLPSARQRGSWRLGNTMQGFFCAALSGFVLQLWSLNVSV